MQGSSDGRERGVKRRVGRRTVGGLLIGGAVGALIGAILGGVIYGFTSGWELVFLLVGLIFGAGVGALVMGMSSLDTPATWRRAEGLEAPHRKDETAIGSRQNLDRARIRRVRSLFAERGQPDDVCRLRQRDPARSRRRTPHAARVLPPRSPRADRYQRRMRHVLVRHLHVLVDGESVKSCTMLAAQADGRSVTTIEGMACDDGDDAPAAGRVPPQPRAAVRLLHPRHDHGGGELPQGEPHPTEEEVRESLEGNLCRCTGYQNIVASILDAAGQMATKG